MGMMPPSAMPISRRAPISATNPAAKPDSTEASENTSVATTSISLRRPILVDQRAHEQAGNGPAE